MSIENSCNIFLKVFIKAFVLNLIRFQEFILAEIPDDAFVCLFAEVEIAFFYQDRGFEFSQDKWPGMYSGHAWIDSK